MNKKTILLVEDNPDDIELTQRAFKKQNILNDMVVVTDGEEALNYLLCKGQYSGQELTPPAVVLLDLNLPKVNGMEVLKEMRKCEHTKYIPVVVLTSSQEERDLVESYKFGANSYIQKPIDFEQFVQAAKTIGLYWLLLNKGLPRR